MKLKTYIVVATLRPGVAAEDVQRVFTWPVASWYRIASNVWIVSLIDDVAILAAMLSPLVIPNGKLFLTKVDLAEKHGLMEQNFWTWLETQKLLQS